MKKISIFLNIRKICSVLTAASFLISSFTANAYPDAKNGVSKDSYSKIIDNLNVIKQEHGRITSVKDLSSDTTVINIQDLHCHFQTQKNISELIKEIADNYPLKSVLIEGGYGNIDISWINRIKNADFKNKVVEKLMQDGYLTGAEYYAIQNKKYNILKGIDQKEIHLKNLSRLAKIMEEEKIYDNILSKINKEIEILNNYYTNGQNKRFSRILSKYKSGKISNVKFYKILFKYIEKINENPEKYNNIISVNKNMYPNISGYIGISKKSNEINTRLLGVQLQQFITVLKKEMSYDSYKKLLNVTNNFSNTEKLIDFLSKVCEAKKFDLSKNFNELNKFINIRKSNNLFNPVELLNEERILTDQIRMALSYDNTEYEIAFITDFQEYFQNYLKYSLNSQDWQYFKQDFDKFRLLYSKYAVIDRLKDIEQDFAYINEYYDVNSDRNNIFITNILNDTDKVLKFNYKKERNAEEILKQSKEIIIVITGGYHSIDLQNILSSQNINSIIITPNITDDNGKANKIYENIIKEQNKLLSQALAFKLASCASNTEQKTLLTKAAAELLGDNLDVLNTLLNGQIAVHKDSEGNTIVKYLDDNSEIKINISLTKRLKNKNKKIKNILTASINQIYDSTDIKELESIFLPDTYKIIKKLSLQLFKMGIYFGNGPVFEIVNSKFNGKYIDGISPEVYSTFLPEIQKMLLTRQIDKTDSKIFNTNFKNSENDEYLNTSDGKPVNYSFADDNIFIPAIDNRFKRKLYRKTFTAVTKILVTFIGIFENQRHYPYFDILKNSKNKTELKNIAGNPNIKLKYRLFALMYLKKNGFYINSSISSDIRDRFIIELRDGGFQIENNFDLRALVTGIFLSLDYFTENLLKTKDKNRIYARISKAVIVKKGKKKTVANAALYFAYFDPLTIAHELGHNILYALGVHASNETELTIHELFADVTANMFGNMFSDYKIDENAVLYDLFNDSFDYNYVFQEEHDAARGFINLLINTSYSANEYMRWERLANIIIDFVTNKKHIRQKQAEVFHSITYSYFTDIVNSETHVRVNTSKIQEVLSTENSYTVVNDILQEIKSLSEKRYSAIIDKIKQTVITPQSYRYTKKSKLDYNDDSVIINNIILSQPNKIYDILKIIKEEILRKFYFTKSEMEILVSIDILLNSDIQGTSRNSFITKLKRYLKYIPDKKACDMDDYRRLEDYINGYEYPELTMKWLNKMLLFFGKKDFNERQKIITAVEYPLIILGMFIPNIRTWFINKHKPGADIGERLNKLETVTENEIIKSVGKSLNEIKNSSFIVKIITIVKIMTDKTVKTANIKYHTELNNGYDVRHITVEFTPYIQNMPYMLEKTDKVAVYISDNIAQFKDKYEFNNTGLNVDGQKIWQINIDGNLVYVSQGANPLQIVKTINNTRIVKNDLGKILNAENDMNLSIDYSVFIDKKSDGIYFDDGIIITNSNLYINSITKIFNSVSAMYAQKTIISLETVQDEKLYQALANGNVRKTISQRQFEFLKNSFEKENKDIFQEISNLRKKGIEIYIKSDKKSDNYGIYGISGEIINNTIYDYILADTSELEIIESNVSIKDLENKIINSDKSLLVGIDILQKIFMDNRDITDAYDGLSSLLGHIKIKFGLHGINSKDMRNFAYSINIDDIPLLTDDLQKNKMIKSSLNDFINIFNIDKNNVISIILNDIKINDAMKNIFLDIIKERILVKTKLSEQNKENGLKDKKLEILLGKVLLLQMSNDDKTSLLSELNIFKGNESDMKIKVNELYMKALTDNDPQTINTIIELILVYSEEIKAGEKIKADDINLASYRKMLAAA
ncbi:MAG: hypothetical protein AB7E39_06475 [Endomicrobiaceae bacterium]